MDAITPAAELQLHYDNWVFGSLRPHAYGLLMVDIPAPMRMRSAKGEKKSPGGKYALMPWAEIEALPVPMLAAPDCVIFFWTTWPILLNGGDPARHFKGHDAGVSPPGRVLKAWGARYVTGGAWLKRTPNGKVRFGPGYRFRSATEPFLIGIIGKPFTTRNERNFIDGLAREHSRKPEEAYALCERWCPGVRRAELFSRTRRPGWDTWGHEDGKWTVSLDEAST